MTDRKAKKKDGWFSRRHKTNGQHLKAKATREAIRDEGREALTVRMKARAGRTAGEQITVLNARLGLGAGAKRERKRLAS
jgi:hypothetical protein